MNGISAQSCLEEVETFTYLGSIVNNHGGTDAGVKARIGKARVAFLQLKNIGQTNSYPNWDKDLQLIRKVSPTVWVRNMEGN